MTTCWILVVARGVDVGDAVGGVSGDEGPPPEEETRGSERCKGE